MMDVAVPTLQQMSMDDGPFGQTGLSVLVSVVEGCRKGLEDVQTLFLLVKEIHVKGPILKKDRAIQIYVLVRTTFIFPFSLLNGVSRSLS